MEQVAIDLGGRVSQICVRSEDGTIIREGRLPTSQLKRFLKTRPHSRVIVETCAEAFAVADAALELGHEARVVPAALVRALGVGERRTKNDQRDARKLSEMSCRMEVPSVHVPSHQARERKTICGMREALVEVRTKLVNTVSGWLRTRVRRLPAGAVKSLPARVRKQLREVPAHVERLLISIEQLTAQIAQADQELRAIAEQDAICQKLMTVPGVGPVTAIRFTATLDNAQRFADAHQLESYLGLVPGEDSSSERKRMTSITKAGSSKMRWALVQACWVARRWRRSDPMVAWSIQVEQRRGKGIAVIALARKMAGILYAIWRDGSTYDPDRGAVRTALDPLEVELNHTVPLSELNKRQR